MKYSYIFANSLFLITNTLALAYSETEVKKNFSNSNKKVSFDTSVLNNFTNSNIDVSRFAYASAVLPGVYSVEVLVNNDFFFKEKITFVEQGGEVLPCFYTATLKKIDLNYNKLTSEIRNLLKDNENHTCHSISTLFPDISVEFDSNEQKLNLSIPQALINLTPRGYVSPELWDKGVPAFLLGYNANAFKTESNGESLDTAYAGLQAQFNLKGWYFKHEGYYNWQENFGSEYQSISNYVQKDIAKINGRIKLGKTNTSTRIFDSIPIIGMEIVNENEMLPASLRGYAPEIRGVARTNAKVTIRQNNRIIYQINTPAGEFLINDLYPTGSSGNLDVTITEADGSIQNFTKIFTAVPQLLRPNAHNYQFAVGRLDDPALSYNPVIFQSSYQRGLTNYITGYTGSQISSKYISAQVGASFNTPIGAFSADVTYAEADLLGGKRTGLSQQIGFSKFISATNTNLTLAAFRYSTENYFDFITAMRTGDLERDGISTYNFWRPRNRFNITISQSLPQGWGEIYVTGYSQNYWNNSENNSDLQYQFGYSNKYRMVNYSIRANTVRDLSGDMNTNWLFNLTIPLDWRKRNISINESLQFYDDYHTHNVGISNSMGDDNQFNYGVNFAHDSSLNNESFSFNGAYRSPYTNLVATYSHADRHKSSSLGFDGSLIAWSEGIVLTPYRGDTFAIVEAKNATSAKVSGYPGIKINRWGFAAVPYLTPYTMNEVTIDPKGLPQDIEFENTSEKIAPYASAISKVIFKTQQGIPLLLNTKDLDGIVLPFGASVLNSQGHYVGTVGQAGLIYAKVEKKTDILTVQWGEDNMKQQCQLKYDVSSFKPNDLKKFIQLNVVCGE